MTVTDITLKNIKIHNLKTSQNNKKLPKHTTLELKNKGSTKKKTLLYRIISANKCRNNRIRKSLATPVSTD